MTLQTHTHTLHRFTCERVTGQTQSLESGARRASPQRLLPRENNPPVHVNVAMNDHIADVQPRPRYLAELST